MTPGVKKFNIITLFFILLIVALIFSIPFSSCSKEGKKENENHCPVIAATAVPQPVKDSFALRYPALTVTTWFQKDSIGYCAYFIQPVNQKKLAEFTKTGSFIMEEIDLDHDGNFEDSTGHSDPKLSGVCECEIPEGK
ncbi:MAG: hypothetical protein HY252_17945 [Sphingobacteriales bacterium]|nr:hypothetical protein [Sphingobacteriales bacterium]